MLKVLARMSKTTRERLSVYNCKISAEIHGTRNVAWTYSGNTLSLKTAVRTSGGHCFLVVVSRSITSLIWVWRLCGFSAVKWNSVWRSVTYKNLLILATVIGFQDALESVGISHPLQQTTLFIQRHDSVGPNVCRQLIIYKAALTKLTSSRLRSTFQEFVDHGIEIHDAGILSQIVVRFAKKRISFAVAAYEDKFLWSLEWWHDVHAVLDI